MKTWNTELPEMAEETNVVCLKKATQYLRVPLKSVEQICLVFLIPAIVNCMIYVMHFTADFVVAVQHFREGNPIWGSGTIALMYAPAVAYFMLTISRPDWWMTDDDKISKGVFLWFALQLFQLIAFPFFALYRYTNIKYYTLSLLFSFSLCSLYCS